MIRFILRRMLASAAILLVLTFAVYHLLDFAMDYFFDLRASTSPNIDQLFESRRRLLNLDTPVTLRYFDWLAGVGGCFIGQCDLGTAWVSGQEVTSQLQGAIANTVKLVTAATLISIVMGVLIGVISALRQYTGFDYVITFVSFLLYSLPVFWVAVLLKQYGAIEFNNFLNNPVVSWPVVIVFAVIAGLFWMGAIGGDARRRVIVFASATVVTFAVTAYVLLTGWLESPRIGLIGTALVSAGFAVAVTFASTGLRNRRALAAALITVVVGLLLYMPLQNLFYYVEMNIPAMLGLLLIALVIGAAIGIALRGPDRSASARTGALTALLMSIVVFCDRVLQEWDRYVAMPQINNRPIATIGAATPNLQADFWMGMLDSFTHLLLPSIALILISFALYTRYERASMLEVMNQDYIRTARAKGLTERTVVMRHGLRNALIPVTSVMAVDIVTLIGGAVITETIFGWSGMGKLFIDSMNRNELDPVMAYILITGLLAIAATLLADFLYGLLDPRIRVTS
ncbi:ABC transporter permease subunit [Sediminivirga luteola]|uniref:ABC transmembrane type-1 domain-containing protein n=1 Tax=Sediminivirga luteola TaxID=1774748 RepID=A0A8J2TWB0_9MICO|nr:ABC transporter permease subunit [Sediminivirga luteola]MCI2265717.1 ABC transporter permease [Sediminivirga luteola]GGA07218.1 hypothetical protein GCM10011333_07300 [Sediminivirga luteola]